MDGLNEQKQEQAALPGTVKTAISRRAIYLAIGLMVFVFLCMAPFWIGVSWWNGGSDVPSVAPVAIYADSNSVYVEPDSIGVGSELEAEVACDADEVVTALYRAGSIAGWGCVK